MLDENLPTYRFRPSSENPLHTLLYFTHNGSEPSVDMLLKRPAPPASHNKYAMGLFDMKYSSVLYAEVLVTPEWTQPTLSAAEVRAHGTSPDPVAVVPRSFSVSLYNPDQTIHVRHHPGSWSKDAWEFEVPERTFRLPSSSRIDQDEPEPQASELVPKVNFRWRRDGRLSRDMTCYMSGRTVGGRKSKEPDITVALFKAGRSDGAVSIYEPNMRRVDVEDRKGLEVVLLLSAEVIRDLYLSPGQDPFNTAGAPPPPPSSTRASTTSASAAAAAATTTTTTTTPVQNVKPPAASRPAPSAASRPDVDAEKRRWQASMEAQADRERRLQREQDEIRRMLEREQREEQERQRRERIQREKMVDRETEELRRKYGIQQQQQQPDLPPRPSGGAVMSGGAGAGWPSPQVAPRPNSVGPSAYHESSSGGGNSAYRKKFGGFLQSASSPYGGPAGASTSTFFGGRAADDDRKKKVKKKRSVQF